MTSRAAGVPVEVTVDDRAALAKAFEVLASDVRLDLLHRLARPRFVPDLVRDTGLRRQTLSRHLEALVEAGLVRAVESRRGALPATSYQADPGGLFAFKESVNEIAVPAPPAPRQATRPAGAAKASRRTEAAGLLVVHGEAPGRWFALEDRDTFVVGRDARCEVPLEWDPFASARHAMLRRGPAGWTVTDLRATNPSLVNFSPLSPAGTLPLSDGDVLTVGRSHLVFRGAR